MISPTPTSEALRSSAVTLQHKSRSVTTPTNLRVSVFSTTGAQPHPDLRMACAAWTAVSFGVQHEDASIGFITSLQQLIVFSLFSSICPPSFSHLAVAVLSVASLLGVAFSAASGKLIASIHWTDFAISGSLAPAEPIFTRFSKSAFATTIKVEPDIERAASSGLSSHPVDG